MHSIKDLSKSVNNNPLISIIILNYNGRGFLEDCLKTVLASDYSNFEVILVDNASTDDSLEFVSKEFSGCGKLRIIKNDKNLLFTEGNNIGIRQAKGEYIIILNNDTTVEKGWLKAIADGMKDNTVGAGQAKIYKYGVDALRLDCVGATINRYGYAKCIGREEIDNGQYDNLKEIFYAAGTAMVIKKDVLNKTGLFDDKFGMYWEDVDLSWRIRLAGYSIITIPGSIVYHKGSLTMSKFAKRADVALHIRKNRIAGLVKNYGLLNLCKYLPVLLISYIALFIKELILNKDLKLACSSIGAIVWNIKELPCLIKERMLVQSKIRVVSDRNILKHIDYNDYVTGSDKK